MNIKLIEHHNENAFVAVYDMKRSINRMKTTLTSRRMTPEKWIAFLVFTLRAIIAMLVIIVELRNAVDLLIVPIQTRKPQLLLTQTIER